MTGCKSVLAGGDSGAAILMKPLHIALAVLAALLGMAMAKKPEVIVRFHAETDPNNGEAFTSPIVFPVSKRKGVVEKVPSLSERDVTAIYPVEAEGGTFGCVFKFDAHGVIALRTLSTAQRGRTLIAFAGIGGRGRQIAEWVIDKPILDGMLFIPSGLSKVEVDLLKKRFPILGELGKSKS